MGWNPSYTAAYPSGNAGANQSTRRPTDEEATPTNKSTDSRADQREKPRDRDQQDEDFDMPQHLTLPNVKDEPWSLALAPC